MNNSIAKSIFFLSLIAVFSYFVLRPTPEPQIEATVQPTQRKVYIGAWVGGSWDSKTKHLNKKAINDFQDVIQQKLAIVNIYSEWTYLSNKNLIKNLDDLSDEGWIPMISSNPFFFEECEDKGKSLYETIASGQCDKFLKSAAENLKNYRKPVMLRFAWEMNLPQMYWGVENVGSTPQDFIEAWRRFYTIAKEAEAENVIWVLSFNTTNSVTIPYKELYPGDKYVDWVAIDGYNWGDSHDWSGWASFDGTFRKSYDELTAITDKPVMLSEVNSAETNGDKAQWLTDMLAVQIPDNYPTVKALIFFNENKVSGESVDWRLEKSEDYVKAVREGLKNNLYTGLYP